MNEPTRIYIAPKTRGRLPWRYRERKPMRGDRWLAFWLLLCALFWGVLWLVLR